jgi:hypothetical protein
MDGPSNPRAVARLVALLLLEGLLMTFLITLVVWFLLG